MNSRDMTGRTIGSKQGFLLELAAIVRICIVAK